MRSRYTFVDSDGIYFLTSTIVEWIPVFTTGEYCEIITDSLAHCRQTRSLRVYAYVVMENHVHIVAESNNLIEVIKTFKRHTAKEIIRLATRTKRDWLLNQFEYYKKRYKRNSRYQVWQEGVHPQLIQGDQMLQQKVAYIHENPVRRGLVAEPEHWRYSSAGNYAEQPNQPMTIDELPL